MKTAKIICSAAGLALLLITTMAFIDLHYEKEIKRMQTSESGNGFAVVELFTSEGCSSCPPAEELIERIQENNQNKQLYIMAFHVDYWDHQGWKDHYSDRAFSLRQRQYASWLNLQTVYTPQLIVNGTKEQIGSDQGAVLKAIDTGLKQASTSTLKLSCQLTKGKVYVNFDEMGNDKASELVLALIQKSATSSVKAGENAGRSLSHVQIVRQLQRIDLSNKKDVILSLPDDFTEKGWELIGFVQNLRNGHISSATRFDFNKVK